MPLMLFFPNPAHADLVKSYIHGHYRINRKTGDRHWVDSYQDKRPERGRTEFAHWQHRIGHFQSYLAENKQREALHAFHDLDHADSHKLAVQLGIADADQAHDSKKDLMAAVHERIRTKGKAYRDQVAAQVKADFERRKAAGTAGHSRPKSVAENIRRGRRAMDRVAATRSDQLHAMYQNRLGWVDFRWGSEGAPPNAKGKRDGAKGIAHIIEARMRKDGLTRDEAVALLSSVVETIARGTPSESRYKNTKTHTEGTKAVLSHAGTEVVLVRDDGQDAWVLTGYEKPSGAPGQGGGKTGATHVGPTPPRPDVGAEDQPSIADPAAPASPPIALIGTRPADRAAIAGAAAKPAPLDDYAMKDMAQWVLDGRPTKGLHSVKVKTWETLAPDTQQRIEAMADRMAETNRAAAAGREKAKADEDALFLKVADKLKAGESLTDTEIEDVGLRVRGSEFSYLSPVVQRLLGISKMRVREAMGDALKNHPTDMGADRWIANPRQALANAAQWVKDGHASSPKDGDRNAEGLVFRDGRWHRDETDAAPWQMTADEFRTQENKPKLERMQAAMRAGRTIVLPSRTKPLGYTKPDMLRLDASGQLQAQNGGKWLSVSDDDMRHMHVQAGGTEPAFMDRVSHAEHVEDAVVAGQPVPAAVLAEYPHLVVRPGFPPTKTAFGEHFVARNGYWQLIESDEDGPFGPIYRQFHHDAPTAIAHLRATQDGEAVGALHHPEVGDIDLVWGEEGTARSDGSGLAKLVKWHPEVMGDLQGFISSLTVKQRDTKRIQLWDGADKRAVVKLTFDDQRKLWLLTAYDKDQGTGRATRPDTGALDGGDDTARPASSSTSSVAEKQGAKGALDGISASSSAQAAGLNPAPPGSASDPSSVAAPAADDQAAGPRDGERNADGLIFRDGRWHREDPPPALDLTSETPDDLKRRNAAEAAKQAADAEAERRAKADQEREPFVLSGSTRKVDELEARGQGNLFDGLDKPEADPPALAKLRAKVAELGGQAKIAKMLQGMLNSRVSPHMESVESAKANALIDGLVDATGATREQVLTALGLKAAAPKPPTPKPVPPSSADSSAPVDDLDPSSPNYRYRDTGYVPGSRKEDAANLLRTAKRSGARVRGNAIDWATLEENPREAKDVITKSHLFGAVDWDALKADGMTPAAGFLVDRVYAAVGKEPADDTPQARKDYATGLESLRDRMERCKTPDDVTSVLKEIRDEYDGVVLNEQESQDYAGLKAQYDATMKPYYAYREQRTLLENKQQVATSLMYRAESIVAKRKGKATDEEKADLKAATERSDAAFQAIIDFDAANPDHANEWRTTPDGGSTNISATELAGRAIRTKMQAVTALAKSRNAIENPLHRAWHQLGERFNGVINYRSHQGSDAFGKHVANAKGGRITDWSWAEQSPKPGAVKGASEESTRFQLLVADTYERVGGRAVPVDSTAALKEAFKLREVQSGNWVLRDVNSAKFHTEQTATAFADLADLIGVPDQQIAMNGRLALAFGARGTGNAGFGGGARAHYEPVQRVINLTKMGGGGCLAHEWFHAFDNLLGEAMGMTMGKDAFLTEGPDALPPGELRDAFHGLRAALHEGPHRITVNVPYSGEDYRLAQRNVTRDHLPEGARDYGMPAPAKLIRDAGDVHAATQAVDAFFAKYPPTNRKAQGQLKQWRAIAAAYYGGQEHGGAIRVESGPAMSSFAREATYLDEGKSRSYWSSTKELAARAFQAWTEDRLQGQGRQSDYLSVKADNTWYRSPLGDPKPFPEGEERTRINVAFDRLMTAVSRGDLLAKALLTVDGPRYLFFKARGWWGPDGGGSHVKQAPHEDAAGLGGASKPSAFAPDPAQADAYRNQLDKALTSRKSDVDAIPVGDTPEVFRALGAPVHPVTISRDVVRKATNGIKHHVTLETIKRLPELLANPVMVFDSATESDSQVAVIDAVDTQHAPILVILRLQAREKRHVVHRVASVYGKDEASVLVSWAGKGLLRYRQTQKSLEWFQSRGLQLPKEGTAQGSNPSVLTEADIVKLRRGGRDSTVPAGTTATAAIADQGPDARLSNGPPARLTKSIDPPAPLRKAAPRYLFLRIRPTAPDWLLRFPEDDR